MVLVNGLKLRYGSQEIFDNISFKLQKGKSIGLVGRNGAGKSTLLKVLSGLEQADSGSISIPKGFRLAYLPQEVVLQSERSVFDEAFSVFDQIDNDMRELARLEEMLAAGDLYEVDDLELYANLHDRVRNSDKNAAIGRTNKVLEGLGFSEERQKKSVTQLSVGWKMRLVLAKLLLSDADFYFFDEPTNHLDIKAKEWFLRFLQQTSCGYLLVSHDRYFLDHACKEILELERGKVNWYTGNFSHYVQIKEDTREKLAAAARLQKIDIDQKKELISKWKATASKAAFCRSLQSQIDRMEIIEVPQGLPTVHFSFPHIERTGAHPLRLKDVSFGFNDKLLFQNVSAEVLRGEKVAIVAANGVGKTTLMNLIVGKNKPVSGEVIWGSNVTTAYFEQDQLKSLDQNKTILQEVEHSCPRSSEAEVRRMLGTFLFSGDDVHKKIKVLSGGEQNRVAMVKVLLERSNVMLLDEPTNHLDLHTKHILLQALQQYQGTMLIVSHDQDFLNHLPSRILELTPTGLNDYNGNYEAYLWHKEKEREQQEALALQQPVKNSASGKSATASVSEKAKDPRKELTNCERKIEKLEHELATLARELEHLTFGTVEYQKCSEKLQERQKDLTAIQSEWESLFALVRQQG